jgi:membrane protein DedA with SNARE-associated domain
MFDGLIHDLISESVGLWRYAVVMGLLLACGLGFPMPEDLILMWGGIAAQELGHSVVPMIVNGLVGIIVGDSMIYWMGRRYGISIAEKTFLRRVFTPERLTRVDEMFKRHGQKVIVAARFIPGVRSVAFFSAGAMGVPFWKFLLFDGLAALVSAPFWVYLAYVLREKIFQVTKEWQPVILGVGAVLALGYGIYAWRKAKRLPAAQPAVAQAGPEKQG